MNKRLKDAIEDRGLRQDFLAKRVLGISPQYFWIKLHQRKFNQTEQAKLAEYLGLPLDELFPDGKAERA